MILRVGAAAIASNTTQAIKKEEIIHKSCWLEGAEMGEVKVTSAWNQFIFEKDSQDKALGHKM